MKTIARTTYYPAPPEEVFHVIDDLGVTGGHMTSSSAMMMGTKLQLEYLTKQHTGLDTRYRWTGKMMGMQMDFTVAVTKWLPGKEKVWETIGQAKLILYSWYRMMLVLEPATPGTKATLSITYKRPKGILNNILSFLFANLYCAWCLNKMLSDTGKTLSKLSISRNFVIQ
jgi:hypothetical protein